MREPYVVIDVESKKTFEEVGAVQGSHEQLGVSFLGVYSSTQDKYFGFFEQDLPKFEMIMEKERPTIIGFNTISFDNPVIQPYMKNLKLADLPQVDILAHLYDALGHRVKLESVAQATLGEGKSGTGLDAIRYYREKNFEALAKYCLDDVRITKEVFDYGRKHGQIYFINLGEPTPVKIPWGYNQSIADKLKEAVTNHKELQIKVLDVSEPGAPKKFETTYEPHVLDDRYVRGYCHLSQKERSYETRLILNIEETGNKIAHQTALI